MTRIVRKLAALAAVLTIVAASVPAAEYMPVTLSVSASAAGAELTEDDVSQFKRDWRNHDYVLKKGLWANNMQSGINCIKDAQRMLNYILGDSLDVDGGFGSATKASTIKFQRKYSLDDDGIIGTGTWNRMIEVVESKIKNSGGSQQSASNGVTYDYETLIANMTADLGKDRYDLGYYDEYCAYYVSDQLRRVGIDIGFQPTPCDVVLGALNRGYGTYYSFREKNYDSLCKWGLSSSGKQRVVHTDRGSVTPQRGDIVIFRFSWESSKYQWSHCGVVTGFDGSTVYSIDGNTGSSLTVMNRARDYNYEVVGLLRI